MAKSKIIATLGPASTREEILTQMVIKGVDIVRINLSHGDYETHNKTFELINQVTAKTGQKVDILCDLQGPKIRLGVIEMEKVELLPGQLFTLTTKSIIGNDKRASVDHVGIMKDVEVGKQILINDGAVKLKVTKIKEDEIETIVEVGGIISNHKGVNLPGMKVSLPPLTEKDIRDLNYLKDKPITYIACSFVRKQEHISEVYELIKKIGYKNYPNIIAKIETQEGVENMKGIVDVADGIMIARGDMAVEMPYEKIPLVQKVLIKLCNRQQKFVITATQMLESMINNAIPTRAEITDVANAVIDGTNAVMLSGETAVGKYPTEVVEAMERIIFRTEKALEDGKIEYNDIF